MKELMILEKDNFLIDLISMMIKIIILNGYFIFKGKKKARNNIQLQ